MLISIAWRNLRRNLRRTLLTGMAVAFAVTLSTCMRGLQDGGYAQMIDQAVRGRLAHLQVHGEDYLERPDADRVVPGAAELTEQLRGMDNVAGVSQRALCDGVAARDSFIWNVEVVGIEPEDEASVSVIDERILSGDGGQAWCQRELTKGRRLFGDDELFDTWCAAARHGRYLGEDDSQGALIGADVAKRLTVSVGDEVQVQVIRAVDSPEEGGAEKGALSQRRLEIVGVVKTGNPEIDDRLVYVPRAVLQEMLGTDEPNEIALLLEDVGQIDATYNSVAALLAGDGSQQVHTWAERNPTLKSLIDTDSQMGIVMLVILVILVALGVVNTTLMSVLERTKEFAIMLALGMRRTKLFALIMAEVSLLGVVSISAGTALGLAFDVYGRVHGWPLEWFTDADMSDLTMSGSVIDPVYYAGLDPINGLIIVVGVFVLFLLAGLLPAIKASRLMPASAMRERG